MKADLYSANARTAGTGGLAHRTTAGFVVVTSSDGDKMIELIDARQNKPDLIDQVVAGAQNEGPSAFAMMFTAGGDLFLILSGSASAAVSSTSARLTLHAAPSQVLVHQLNAGINEAGSTIRLHAAPGEAGQIATEDLLSGTVEATWAEVAVGDAELTQAPPAQVQSAPAAEEPAAAEPAAAEAELLAPEPEAPVVAEPPEPEAAPPAEEPAAADPPAPEPEAPVEEPATPDVEPVAIMAPTDPAPPAAQGIVFADDLDEIADLIDDPAPVVEVAPSVGPIMVLGVACSQGHHNHPDAVYCSQCGTKMGVHHTTVLLNGPRPPLGVLVVDDGTTYSLNEDLVIGREPSSHDDVVAGTASPMILTDDTLSLSRKHARIVLDEWTVLVRDLKSSNGTWISRAGAAEAWTKVEPELTMKLEPGDRLRVGGRIIQVELHHVR